MPLRKITKFRFSLICCTMTILGTATMFVNKPMQAELSGKVHFNHKDTNTFVGLVKTVTIESIPNGTYAYLGQNDEKTQVIFRKRSKFVKGIINGRDCFQGIIKSNTIYNVVTVVYGQNTGPRFSFRKLPNIVLGSNASPLNPKQELSRKAKFKNGYRNEDDSHKVEAEFRQCLKDPDYMS
jgi:hypothetical protein